MQALQVLIPPNPISPPLLLLPHSVSLLPDSPPPLRWSHKLDSVSYGAFIINLLLTTTNSRPGPLPVSMTACCLQDKSLSLLPGFVVSYSLTQWPSPAPEAHTSSRIILDPSDLHAVSPARTALPCHHIQPTPPFFTAKIKSHLLAPNGHRNLISKLLAAADGMRCSGHATLLLRMFFYIYSTHTSV